MAAERPSVSSDAGWGHGGLGCGETIDNLSMGSRHGAAAEAEHPWIGAAACRVDFSLLSSNVVCRRASNHTQDAVTDSTMAVVH